VKKQQRELGQEIPDAEVRNWEELSDEQKEVYRKSADSLALPEYLMWDAIAQMRKKMGEKAFRRKMFELSVSVAFQRLLPDRSEAARYQATDYIVKLSNMLEVPPSAEQQPG